MDIYQICLDEVALEGLDGITISALWLRLNQREEKISVKLSLTLQEILWKFLLQHSSIEFYQIPSDRCDPVIFNRYMGIDVTTGKHIAIAPDELDLLQEIYYVKPVTTQPNIKGSCSDFDSRINVTNQLREKNMSLSTTINSFGEQRLVIVASQSLREGVLRGSGVTSQTVESLTDIEYCILERIGRSRWQGEIQTVLNNNVFKQLKSAHIHYMMKSLFQKGLVTKQPYSYVRDDKGGKVYQQILLHLPHFKTDARSVSDIRAETICEMLKQTETRSISCNDLRQIISVDGKVFRKLTAKMIAAGYVKVENLGSTKQSDKIMTLIKTPSEKQEEEILDDTLDDSTENDGDSVGLVAELPLTLQGFRHIFSTGENGCSQAMLHRKLKGYGSLEARHLCRKVEKAKIVKIIMIDHGKQRTQKYIAENFARNSLHTKEFFEEKKKMQKIMETSDISLHGDSSVLNASDVVETTVDDSQPTDNRLSESADVNSTNHDAESNHNSAIETSTSEVNLDSSVARLDNDVIEVDQAEALVKRSKWDTHQTTRKMKRTNTILSYINEQKVVEGFFALQKILQAEEKDEGLTTKVCKKTVKRLVQKLHNDSLIKHFSIPITSNDCTIDVDFVMSLDCDPLRLKTAIEQAQFKKYSEDSKKIAAEQAEVVDLTGPNIGLAGSLHSAMNLTDIIKVEDCKPNSKLQYGYQPKFLRNQVVHEYLWYLAYGHPYNDKENLEMLDYDKIKEYSSEKNWKRFLPPAPSHPDFGPGWLQVGDAAVLLPLSILCQFHQYPYKIEGLEQYVNDSTQKNTLVRHLPLRMRGLIFYKRKYLLSLIQVIECLCFMGLITFNKQNKNVNIRTKKEFEMIYVHRNISMLDTRRSEKGYSEVSEGVDYEQLRFKLNEFSDVERFWLKLRDICLMTPLGVRNGEESEPEPGARHTVKLKLFIAEHVARDQRDPVDDGSIPGDNRGAGGLDSSLFAHLYRNWFRTMKIVKNTDEGNPERDGEEFPKEKPVRLPKLVPTALHLSEEGPKRSRKKTKCGENSGKQQPGGKRVPNQNASTSAKKQKLDDAPVQNDVIVIDDVDKINQDSNSFDYEVVTENNVGRNEKVKGGRGKKRTFSVESQPAAKKKKPAPASTVPKKKEKYIDLLDKQARSNMNGKLRVSFSSAEDEILLMCRIASSLISKTIKVKHRLESQNVVSGLLIRNILWKNCKESTDKTSVACLRRIRMLMKNKSAKICHDINVAEVLLDRDCLMKLFESVRDKNMLEKPEEIEPLFVNTFEEVFRRFRNCRPESDVALPDTIQELEESYVTKVFTATKQTSPRIVKEVTCPRDITLCTLENLMYVTLSLNEDEFSQYQAYNLFANFPDELMYEVWQHIKFSGIICQKPDMYLNRQRHLPFAVPKFHLSKIHFQRLQAGSMWRIFSEIFSCVKDVKQDKKLVCDKTANSGPVVLLNLLLLDEGDYFKVKYSSLNETSKEKTMSALLNESSDLTNQTEDSDDDDSQGKRTVTKNELFHLYKRKRFANDVRQRYKIIAPLIVECVRSDLFSEKAFANDVSKTVDALESVKLADRVISVDDDDDSEMMTTLIKIKEKNSESMGRLVDRVLEIVKEAGVIGASLPEIKLKLLPNSDLFHLQLDACIDTLSDHRLICMVGMWNKRVVLKKYADQWFVSGTVFKGDRKLLVQEIRKELSQATSRYSHTKKGPNPAGHRWNSETYAVFKNSIPINCDEGTSSQEHSAAVSTPMIVADDDVNEKPTASNEGVKSTCLLSDASYYSRIKFLCRPWHNVSGEINYRTAKLLLTGIFVQILWSPGITLRRLTDRFIGIMQRISLIELLEKLISFECIERRTCSRFKPWRLFSQFELDSLSSMTSSDDDYFLVTGDGMLRMTFLCRELERLQSVRNSALSLPDNSVETE